jgi:hypothetical protein
VTSKLGKGAGADGKVLGTLIGAGEKMLGVLNGNMPAQPGGNANTDYAQSVRGEKLLLFDSHSASSPTQQAETIAHESAHEGVNAIDMRESQGRGKPFLDIFGPSLISWAARTHGPSEMLGVADALALALGMDRDEGAK